jgi:RNA polymerase sigma factor (sigma-70 family)
VAESDAIVFVVDDNAPVREAVASLLKSVGLRVQTFASAQEFLGAERPDAPACLVLDVRLPGLSGLDLQRELAEADVHIPIIFITGHGDIPMSVRAMKAGAVEFLTKPFRDQDLLDAITQAVALDRSRRQQRAELADLRARYESLTPREREVMALVAAGLSNDEIAQRLVVSPATAKTHVSRVLRKLDARDRAQLVVLAYETGLVAARQETAADDDAGAA